MEIAASVLLKLIINSLNILVNNFFMTNKNYRLNIPFLTKVYIFIQLNTNVNKYTLPLVRSLYEVQDNNSFSIIKYVKITIKDTNTTINACKWSQAGV